MERHYAHIFEHAMMPEGSLEVILGSLTGTVLGSGMLLMFAFLGVLYMLIDFGAYAFQTNGMPKRVCPITMQRLHFLVKNRSFSP